MNQYLNSYKLLIVCDNANYLFILLSFKEESKYYNFEKFLFNLRIFMFYFNTCNQDESLPIRLLSYFIIGLMAKNIHLLDIMHFRILQLSLFRQDFYFLRNIFLWRYGLLFEYKFFTYSN